MYIPRAQEQLVLRYSSTFKAVVVTGPRQVGKTTMLRHLIETTSAENDRRYVSLDNTGQRVLAKSDPELFLQRFKPPVLIDEIQYAPELLPYIKLIADNSDAKGQFWLTGSQPFHLMKSVSESLAGRVGLIEMLGFSNAEISNIENEPFVPSPDYFQRRVSLARPLTLDETFNRIVAGSFPGIMNMDDDVRSTAYDALIDTYLMRDIRDLSQVSDELKFRQFMMAVASLTSRPVVYAELARLADVDQKTAKAWLSLLTSSYLVKIVRPYSNNVLKRLVKQPIMHFIDTGLAAHLAGWDNAVALERGALGGQFFESYVFGEIYKSYANAGQRAPLYFFRNNDRKEIDLLLERNGALHPIEIKKSASPTDGDTKNFPALDPVASNNLPYELRAHHREIATGVVVCMTSDTYPVNRRAWAFPSWAV